MTTKAKWTETIVVNDPDGGTIEIAIYKHPNGGMFGLDASYIDQVLGVDDESPAIIPDPFATDMYTPLELVEE